MGASEIQITASTNTILISFQFINTSCMCCRSKFSTKFPLINIFGNIRISNSTKCTFSFFNRFLLFQQHHKDKILNFLLKCKYESGNKLQAGNLTTTKLAEELTYFFCDLAQIFLRINTSSKMETVIIKHLYCM